MTEPVGNSCLEQSESTGSGVIQPLASSEAASIQQEAHTLPSLPTSNRGAVIFVFGIWLASLLSAVYFVAKYGHSVPWNDDFATIQYLTGDQPLTVSWLWSQHNEHRIPLPRLILVALATISGCDFRAGMYFNVLCLGGLAFAMALTAKEVRGRTAYTDAIFPLGLLHWGHYENMLWAFQVGFIAPLVLSGILLLIIVRKRPPLSARTALLFGSSLVLLPFCGASGIVFVVPGTCWFVYCGVATWTEGLSMNRRTGILVLGLSMLALLLVGLYFVGYNRTPHGRATPDLWTMLRVSLEFLTTSYGPLARGAWPYVALVIGILVVVSGGGLILAWFKEPRQRSQSLGLLLFMASIAGLGLGVGSGRPGGFAARYVSLALPMLFCIYFMSQLFYGSCRQFIQLVLFTLISSAWLANMNAGATFARDRHQALTAFEADISSGTPGRMLAERYQKTLNQIRSVEFLEQHLYKLHKAGIEPYDIINFSKVPDKYNGHHDSADCEGIGGWAWDEARPNTPIEVDIYDGERLLATVHADRFRAGLHKAGFGDGRHGFYYPLPAAVKDGATHVICVKIAGTEIELRGTRKVITCAKDK